jgi:8-oxo-dGTP diphosphatase
MSHTYPYPRPAVTTDVVLLSHHDRTRQVLLIQRKHAPFQGHWALPGGFLDDSEDPAVGAARELKEETSLHDIPLSPLGFWGRPGRDPRANTISLVFGATVAGDRLHPQAADDAGALAWFPLDALPPLAFDHDEIIDAARRKESGEAA